MYGHPKVKLKQTYEICGFYISDCEDYSYLDCYTVLIWYLFNNIFDEPAACSLSIVKC